MSSKQNKIFFEEKLFRTRGKLKYKHLKINERINLKGNMVNHMPMEVIIKERITIKKIERLIQLIQYQWAGKERRVYHDQYSLITKLF